MTDLLHSTSPARNQAGSFKSAYGLDNYGLTNLKAEYWNLPTEVLYEEIIARREGMISHLGPIVLNSGKHTARSAQDKYIVREPSTEDKIWWGDTNRPISPETFDTLYNRIQGYVQGRDLFVQDCFVGADPDYRLPVRVISEYAWHSLFARNMFLLPEGEAAYRSHVPGFTVIAVPGFAPEAQLDGLRSSTFIVLNFEKRMCIIGDTAYSGEIKKSVFTLMNFLLPLQNVMTMHCSANIGEKGDTALFFGLSGTGKTTLSADPSRGLIGDDEHGWSDNGVFNFEGGCYAKVIRLSATAEPEIYAATRRFGTILENVGYDPVTRRVDLNDASITENTRASYPLDYIANAVEDKRGGHPQNIVLLTCDAQGVLPPLARLSTNQALYHFISGYTSKVAGTEVGLGKEPQITFSTCFGAPFMVHHPSTYAALLKDKMERYGATCWLLNTGWIGGPFGVGRRISIQYTRALLNAALNGQLDGVEYYHDPVFGFEVPRWCPGVPEEILYPAQAWSSEEAYWQKYRELAARFTKNFAKFADGCPPEVCAAGPVVEESAASGA
ncbi:MAG TPA: phosphoenolpyruvate carboxykinase (ATP) [Aggregatilinea sp.]|uniref:phosphoenolpyruvate carboxykinase (ATP) n=1 Tax=Aggregatilinea sp. TaxID=2806333 RepID=UPI002C52F24A|nr:phosphoenolpyruvate carboxykinase (ATP) [Aggregatilinea sp.]HML22480.1 phosphoenolpyruvate carboxykinase (ATP) [Aggregatilinea sp.]